MHQPPRMWVPPFLPIGNPSRESELLERSRIVDELGRRHALDPEVGDRGLRVSNVAPRVLPDTPIDTIVFLMCA